MKNSPALFLAATLLLSASACHQDAPPVVTEILQLHHADAKQVSEVVNKLVEAKAQREAPSEHQAPPLDVNPQLAAAFLSPKNRINGIVKLTPDMRTNRIRVDTLPENLPAIRSLVNRLEAGIPIHTPSATRGRLQKSSSE